MADLHTLTGAYALPALDEEERGRFDRHAADCESCRREVRELAAAAARLGLAAATGRSRRGTRRGRPSSERPNWPRCRPPPTRGAAPRH
ncbi:zf-HC2 domain-containing protein [Streptomyces mirabilis]|uniref:zf-HC2 domain-containing protein n=1 Tax=Streptomyces mirabilis TaxID=68239 RepID=UPI003BEEB3C2